MATLVMNLSEADLTAAIQQWVASTTGGSVSGVTHQMNATVAPVIIPNGGLQVQLNF